MKAKVTYINNRKARYNYYIESSYTAGIVLQGSEVKSIRSGHMNISEAYCYFNNGELFLRNALISSIGHQMFGHEEIHDRKLLLNKKELKQLQKYVSLKGNTIVPMSVVIPDGGFIKVQIATCKGKHNYDKRNAIKERDLSREMR